jgi:hypothetical protein
MLRKLPYKTKLQLLAVLAIIALLICYRFGIAKTITAYHSYTQQKERSVHERESSYRLQVLRSKERKLDKIMLGFMLDTVNTDKNILSIASIWCKTHDLIIKEFKPFAYSTIDSIQIITQSLTVAGNFVDCLKLVYALETNFKAGKISSVVYRTQTDNRTKIPELNCTIYIQNLNNNTDENS